ncbi:hypothetical protein LR48_Vigan08g105900 [Vigna angularis]|uniref:Uncharacterized protein n=1 Tax=Phaseolus angularis TaxID=3914 RepID=A0A0L9V5J5_PHAAN|nr:hypothetical protein LR48_Vigan08g105900 [Vigna angularis]
MAIQGPKSAAADAPSTTASAASSSTDDQPCGAAPPPSRDHLVVSSVTNLHSSRSCRYHQIVRTAPSHRFVTEQPPPRRDFLAAIREFIFASPSSRRRCTEFTVLFSIDARSTPHHPHRAGTPPPSSRVPHQAATIFIFFGMNTPCCRVASSSSSPSPNPSASMSSLLQNPTSSSRLCEFVKLETPSSSPPSRHHHELLLH